MRELSNCIVTRLLSTLNRNLYVVALVVAGVDRAISVTTWRLVVALVSVPISASPFPPNSRLLLLSVIATMPYELTAEVVFGVAEKLQSMRIALSDLCGVIVTDIPVTSTSEVLVVLLSVPSVARTI